MDRPLATEIPPLEHTYKSITYTCAGHGLLKDGYEYHAHPEKFFPPKPPKVSQSGNSAEQPQVEKKPAAWWKAQCAFRGLNQSGSVHDLQLRLKEAKKKMPPELKEAETQLNKEYKKKSKGGEDKAWKLWKSAEQKAAKDPERYLIETFPKGDTGRPTNFDIVVLKVEGRAAIYAAAEKLGLEVASADAPWTSNKAPSPDKWIIVGRSANAVLNQMREIEREAIRSQEIFRKGKAKASNAKRKSIPTTVIETESASKPPKKQTAKRGAPFGMSRISQPPPATDRSSWPKQTAKRASPLGMSRVVSPVVKNEALERPKACARRGGISASASRRPTAKDEFPEEEGDAKPKTGSWDVTGSYVIQCPKISDEWDDGGPMTLEIFHENVGQAYQMYAHFSFNVVEGVLRFMKPLPAPRYNLESSNKRKREDEEDDDGDVDMDRYPAYDSGTAQGSHHYDEKDFRLGAKDKPTARRPTWPFRWRGRETGEGQIQLYSDEVVQSITFTNKGNALTGVLKNVNFVGECRFTGVKLSQATTRYGSINSAWNEYSEEAYEEARIGRWH